jgi:hypothetical protein
MLSSQNMIKKPMLNFLRLWAGQFFSMLCSSISSFALGIWAWELTGLATPFGMVGFQFLLPDHDDAEKAAKS